MIYLRADVRICWDSEGDDRADRRLRTRENQDRLVPDWFSIIARIFVRLASFRPRPANP
jgi:hypothetical protein